jgi:short subunit dehydrogenase-like uncharacterized protein
MTTTRITIDLAVYGASGFTGRQTSSELWRACQGRGLTLGLAGRNRAKLEEVRRSLGESAVEKVEIRVADSADRPALDELARQTRVVVNTAGPYAKYAPELLRACVEQNTDYVDITGETPFVRRMIDELHAKAVSRGVRIVPFCGYDSIPSDLGFWWVSREWTRAHPDEALTEVIALFQARGGVNGGTLASAMNMAASGDFRLIQDDTQLLTPAGAAPAPMRGDWRTPRRIRELGLWGAPFFMAPINTRVVRRSQALAAATPALAPSPDYTRAIYQEGLGFRGFGTSLGIAAAESLIEGLPRPRPVVEWLSRKLPQPGTGPDEATRKNGLTRTLYLAFGARGSTWKGEWFFKGDPGNAFTVRALSESALCLAIEEERAKLPRTFGILTPATAFGSVLLERLRGNGVTIKVTSSPDPTV